MIGCRVRLALAGVSSPRQRRGRGAAKAQQRRGRGAAKARQRRGRGTSLAAFLAAFFATVLATVLAAFLATVLAAFLATILAAFLATVLAAFLAAGAAEARRRHGRGAAEVCCIFCRHSRTQATTLSEHSPNTVNACMNKIAVKTCVYTTGHSSEHANTAEHCVQKPPNTAEHRNPRSANISICVRPFAQGFARLAETSVCL